MSAADAIIGEDPGKQSTTLEPLSLPLAHWTNSQILATTTKQPLNLNNDDDENDEGTGSVMIINADVTNNDDENDDRCGFPGCHPSWLQRFASVRWFVLDFVLQGIVQGMFYTCWVSSVSTIEKRFHLPSKMVGLTGSFGEIGYVATVFCFAHYGGTGHRPRWLAAGVLLMAISALFIALPELFAPDLNDSMDIIVQQANHDIGDNNNSTVQRHRQNLCARDEVGDFYSRANNGSMSTDECTNARQAASSGSFRAFLSFGLFVFGWILMNAGTPAGPTVGMPFIYDSVELKNSPMYFAVTFLGRIFGPFLGFALGSACSTIYTNFNPPEGITTTSPQWIGAWWLGFLVIATLQFIIAASLFAFPPVLRGSFMHNNKRNSIQSKPLRSGEAAASAIDSAAIKKPSAPTRPDEMIKFRDIPKALKTVLLNPTLMIIAIGRSIDIFGSIGLWLFEPKYVENQFRVSAAQASMLLATTMILSFGVGSMVGGYIIRRFKLRPRGIAILIAVFSVLNALGFFVIMQLQCADERISLFGVTTNSDIVQSCNADCECSAVKSLAPVCDRATGLSYPTACYAGCKSFNSELNVFQNCSCAAGRDLSPSYCQGPCSIWTYAAASMTNALMGGMTLVGGIMIVFAVVEPSQKSMAQAVISLMVTMFGFLPGAPLMGMFIDNACLLWSTKTAEACGAGDAGSSSVGNCLFYDIDKFRYSIFGITGGARLFGCLFDLILVWLVRHVSFPGREMDAL